ncbi:MAG TPA: GNAT family N-acetyltransferase [Bacteroidales bacterium]|jgi:GNAT superfamily N-acetyltransferase|nr:GNAT family N-acetyltransferase [Bacteroidales bacterium]HBZ20639.1 GNAT family N-acetyltransferase [Bacteroidales bacterium]
MILIRKAVPSDAPSIVDFQLRMALETEDMKLVPEIVTKGVDAVFNDSSKGQYYVAEADGIVIASLLITYEWSDWRNCNVWWFQSVYVVPGFRRTGVFRKMYSHIRELAVLMDIAGLRLYVETKNSKAQKTYEALGMSSEHYAFYEWMRK